MLRRVLAQLFLALCILLPRSGIGETRCCVPIRLDVNPKPASNDRTDIFIKLTNAGSKPLEFSIGFGPWAGLGQINVMAMRLPSGDPIVNRTRALKDPALGFITLKPGESIERSVPLDELFPEVADEIRRGRNDVVLFWTYQLIARDAMHSSRVGGWFEFPANSEHP